MINKFFKKYFFQIAVFLFFIFITNQQFANEILIYADRISYDQQNNIIAKGKAKILYDNKVGSLEKAQVHLRESFSLLFRFCRSRKNAC